MADIRTVITRTRKANLRKRAKAWMAKQAEAEAAKPAARKATAMAVKAKEEVWEAEAKARRERWEATLTDAQKARNAKVLKEMYVGSKA